MRRCKITTNPCGTDTWAVGRPCQCDECQAYLKETTETLAKFATAVAPHRGLLIVTKSETKS